MIHRSKWPTIMPGPGLDDDGFSKVDQPGGFHRCSLTPRKHHETMSDLISGSVTLENVDFPAIATDPLRSSAVFSLSLWADGFLMFLAIYMHFCTPGNHHESGKQPVWSSDNGPPTSGPCHAVRLDMLGPSMCLLY